MKPAPPVTRIRIAKEISGAAERLLLAGGLGVAKRVWPSVRRSHQASTDTVRKPERGASGLVP
jgi:hypothetical protein